MADDQETTIFGCTVSELEPGETYSSGVTLSSGVTVEIDDMCLLLRPV